LQWLVVSVPTLEHRFHLRRTLQHLQHRLLVEIINMQKMLGTSFTCQLQPKPPECVKPPHNPPNSTTKPPRFAYNKNKTPKTPLHHHPSSSSCFPTEIQRPKEK
jgi:hypothetical protein